MGKNGAWVNNSGKTLRKQYTHRFPGLGWYFGIPDFKVTNGFTYALESLTTKATSDAINGDIAKKMIDKKNKLGEDATAALKNVMNSFKNIDKTDSYLRNALKFLKRAADSERKKETMIL